MSSKGSVLEQALPQSLIVIVDYLCRDLTETEIRLIITDFCVKAQLPSEYLTNLIEQEKKAALTKLFRKIWEFDEFALIIKIVRKRHPLSAMPLAIIMDPPTKAAFTQLEEMKERSTQVLSSSASTANLIQLLRRKLSIQDVQDIANDFGERSSLGTNVYERLGGTGTDEAISLLVRRTQQIDKMQILLLVIIEWRPDLESDLRQLDLMQLNLSSESNTSKRISPNPNKAKNAIENKLEKSMTTTPQPIEVFFSYSHKDERYRTKLVTHLSSLKRQNIISEWHDRKITAGSEWREAIDEHLNSAQIILLLVSPDFMASDYCYDKEMKYALEQHNKGQARVIPVIIRPVDWHSSPFSKLQALPRDGKAVTKWSTQDEGFYDVVQGIRAAVEELHRTNP